MIFFFRVEPAPYRRRQIPIGHARESEHPAIAAIEFISTYQWFIGSSAFADDDKRRLFFQMPLQQNEAAKMLGTPQTWVSAVMRYKPVSVPGPWLRAAVAGRHAP